MISKCHTTEIQNEIYRIVTLARYDLSGTVQNQVWLNRMAILLDTVWELYRIDAISEKTFDMLADPIRDFEFDHGFKLICRYNVPNKF